jgi:hypothetical protein
MPKRNLEHKDSCGKLSDKVKIHLEKDFLFFAGKEHKISQNICHESRQKGTKRIKKSIIKFILTPKAPSDNSKIGFHLFFFIIFAMEFTRGQWKKDSK